MSREFITIVSGLPRSGTSMMMSALVAGGLSALTDNIRTADEDNPKGYFEFEKVKELDRDNAWLEGARGKVVKIISALLKRLPDQHRYKIIFMRLKNRCSFVAESRLIKSAMSEWLKCLVNIFGMSKRGLKSNRIWMSCMSAITKC